MVLRWKERMHMEKQQQPLPWGFETKGGGCVMDTISISRNPCLESHDCFAIDAMCDIGRSLHWASDLSFLKNRCRTCLSLRSLPLKYAMPSSILKVVGQNKTRAIHDSSYLAFNTSRIYRVNALWPVKRKVTQQIEAFNKLNKMV